MSAPTERAAAQEFRRGMALVVAATLFMETLDATIVATAVPAIGRSLYASPTLVGSAVTAYLLSVAVFVPLSGWLTGRYGNRRVLLAAILVFTGASVLCAAATSVGELIAFRAAQGLGGALMVPVGQLTVFRAARKQDLYRAVAYVTWPALIAPAVAPLLGGILVSYAGWRWIFLINLPVGAAVFVAGWLLVDDAARTRPPRFDLLGFVCTAVGVGALTLTSAMSSSDWRPGPAAAMGCVVALVALGGAVAHLLRCPAPLLDLRALLIPSMRIAFASGGVFRMAVSAVPFLLPVIFQQVWGWSAVHAGAVTLWLFVGNLAIKAVVTPLLRRWAYRTVLRASVTTLSLTIIAMAFLGPTTANWLVVGVLVVNGAARSLGFTCLNTLAYADVPAARWTAANTLAATLGQLAAGLGVAVATAGLAVGAAGDATGGGAGDFRLAFVLIAALCAIPLLAAWRMDARVGEDVHPKARRQR